MKLLNDNDYAFGLDFCDYLDHKRCESLTRIIVGILVGEFLSDCLPRYASVGADTSGHEMLLEKHNDECIICRKIGRKPLTREKILKHLRQNNNKFTKGMCAECYGYRCFAMSQHFHTLSERISMDNEAAFFKQNAPLIASKTAQEDEIYDKKKRKNTQHRSI